ncbi:tail fiber assembly protein [Escherichia coli O15:H18]|uniref:tail fiber assembly protein n=1 Tax=Escherichia coli TaxID=562 RepID=UPI00214FD268|nr:tail fiber assembly protein [Escherichia coli]UUX62719.1 tail fiber assembly protein [Escherichia coli O15:H18]
MLITAARRYQKRRTQGRSDYTIQPGDYPALHHHKTPATPWDTWNGEAWVKPDNDASSNYERHRMEVARQQRQQRVETGDGVRRSYQSQTASAGRSLTPEETKTNPERRAESLYRRAE